MPDDLLTTVKAALALDTGCLCGLPQCAECRAWSPLVENRNILRALLARCEAAEGCDGNCSCVVMSRHEWQRAYSEERLKREAAEAERDALRLMNDPERGEKQALIARLVKAESELAAARAERDKYRDCRGTKGNTLRLVRERDAARAEAARLKKELAAKIPGQVVQSIRDDRDRLRAEAARLRDARADDVALVARLSHQVVALRDAITRVLDGPHYIDRDYQDVLLAALDTPAREGGEG